MADDKTQKPSKPRGFAAMDAKRQREIASLGGQTAHRLGKAHRFSVEEARAAGAAGHRTRKQQQQKAAGGMSASASTANGDPDQKMASSNEAEHAEE
ncbi:KGG domain-containing protein [Pigmentiphaga litoralis]|uniref:KGG domain-containing protein n=1 Tax=Pigmentiphaga litoralis TaxID=516702 RepID=UPI003B4331E1